MDGEARFKKRGTITTGTDCCWLHIDDDTATLSKDFASSAALPTVVSAFSPLPLPPPSFPLFFCVAAARPSLLGGVITRGVSLTALIIFSFPLPGRPLSLSLSFKVSRGVM